MLSPTGSPTDSFLLPLDTSPSHCWSDESHLLRVDPGGIDVFPAGPFPISAAAPFRYAVLASFCEALFEWVVFFVAYFLIIQLCESLSLIGLGDHIFIYIFFSSLRPFLSPPLCSFNSISALAWCHTSPYLPGLLPIAHADPRFALGFSHFCFEPAKLLRY